MRTTFLEPTSFGDATVMIEMCCTEMIRGGFEDEAAQLRGLEVFSVTDALCALTTLHHVEPTGTEVIDSAVRHTTALLESLTLEAPLACAG